MSQLVGVYVVQPYERLDGDFEPGVSVECETLGSAVSSAEELSRTYGGAVVLSAKADLATGLYSSYAVLQKFGEVPEDRNLMP